MINLAFVLAVILLPVFIILQLNPVLSVPIGALVFWAWGLVLGDIPRFADPAYDSFGPAIWALFGWIPAVVYCLIVLVVSNCLSNTLPWRSNHLSSLVLWLTVLGFCSVFLYVTLRFYGSELIAGLLFTAVGPILLFCIAMVFSIFFTMCSSILNRKPANMQLHLDAAARRE